MARRIGPDPVIPIRDQVGVVIERRSESGISTTETAIRSELTSGVAHFTPIRPRRSDRDGFRIGTRAPEVSGVPRRCGQGHRFALADRHIRTKVDGTCLP